MLALSRRRDRTNQGFELAQEAPPVRGVQHRRLLLRRGCSWTTHSTRELLLDRERVGRWGGGGAVRSRAVPDEKADPWSRRSASAIRPSLAQGTAPGAPSACCGAAIGRRAVRREHRDDTPITDDAVLGACRATCCTSSASTWPAHPAVAPARPLEHPRLRRRTIKYMAFSRRPTSPTRGTSRRCGRCSRRGAQHGDPLGLRRRRRAARQRQVLDCRGRAVRMFKRTSPRYRSSWRQSSAAS